MSTIGKTRVLIVDDSAVIRQTLERELAKDLQIEVIGTAPDPFVARDKIVALKPDVITLDIEMPRMDGVSFLKRLMHHYPIPVIIVSSLAQKGSQIALEAMEAGAVDVVAKPGSAYSIGDMSVELCEKIKAAAKVDLSRLQALQKTLPAPTKPSITSALTASTHKVVALGASTGGTQAIEHVLKTYPASAPGMVIVQHMPAGFTKSFSDRLNQVCEVEVREAQDGDTIAPGKVLVAPGNKHMKVKRSGAIYYVEVKDGPLVNRHRPSVSVLFHSVAQHIGRNAIGVMLTGMGNDGTDGMVAMKEAGAWNIGQDESSCVVYGMPRAAFEAGAIHLQVPLSRVTQSILEAATKNFQPAQN